MSQTMSFQELQIIVETDDRVVCRSSGGAEVAGRFRLSALHRRLIRIFDEWLRGKKITKRPELEALGSLLFESLLDGETAAFFRRRLEGVAKGDRLRVQLVFHRDAFELAAIPWEFLYSPDSETRNGFFLATRTDLVLSRYLPLEEDRQPLKAAEHPLRLLAVVSEPTGLAPVVAGPLLEQLRELQTGGLPIEITTLEQPTLELLLETVEDYKPHLLHYFGHGQFAGRGQLALIEEGTGAARWVNDTQIVNLFERTQPRLVFLQACEGAQINFGDNFAGVAPQLVRGGIPAVVAMQYPITNKAAIDFSHAFYRALAKGDPVDAALQEGRRRINLSNAEGERFRDFGTPVLYMRSRDGVILP